MDMQNSVAFVLEQCEITWFSSCGDNPIENKSILER